MTRHYSVHREFLSSALITLALSAFGCGGQLFIDAETLGDPCGSQRCATGFVCDEGDCVAEVDPCEGITDGACRPCSPTNPGGPCPQGSQCVEGVCYDDDVAPKDCDDGGSLCPGDLRCENGACVDIPTENECSPDVPAGICPDTQQCVEGVCFIDEGIDCSGQNPQGYCPDGQVCTAGSCLPQINTCSPINPEGSCSAWETCVQGQCVGPLPPDHCAPERPNGRCPADEVCVGGACAPFDGPTACSPDVPTGLCPPGAACIDGGCVQITDDNACSVARPDGACPGGAICEDGACVHQACEDGGLLCEPGSICNDSACLPVPCDPSHPGGLCDEVGLVCVSGICIEPPCSIEYPDGECLQPLICEDGSCQGQRCSADFPFGRCDGTDICVAGTCLEGPCASDNLDGTCGDVFVSCKPGEGCGFFADEVCCQETSADGTCVQGECGWPACSADEPNGYCPGDSFCNEGTCAAAPCGQFFPGGTCDNAAQQCYLGSCRLLSCADEPNPDEFCGPGLVCEQTLDLCVPAPCSEEFPDGRCEPGQACCNTAHAGEFTCSVGTCFAPTCSLTFPGGACPPGTVCAGGGCVEPPCSEGFPEGRCGPNFECDDGSCAWSACSATAPQGSCELPGAQCFDGECKVFECSVDFPAGPCTVGTICTPSGPDFVCQTPACSAQYPGGACGAGQLCVGGTCIDEPCSAAFPDGACAAAFECDDGRCEATPCSPGSPQGPCEGADAGKVCLSGTCVDYECSTNFLGGPCSSSNQICDNGVCITPDCSVDFPGGACPGTAVCVSGSCITPACSPSVTDGACPGGQTCCDAGLAGSRSCSVGSCVLADCADRPNTGYCPSGQRCSGTSCLDYECGTDFPNGPCSNPAFDCIDNICQDPPCDAQHPTGICTDTSLVCINGTCTNPPCSAAYPSGQCSTGKICCDDTITLARGCTEGTCVLEDCAADNETGWCPSGQVCCTDDLRTSGFCDPGDICKPTECSAEFPFGSCPGAGEICVSGVCETPCSATAPEGWCLDEFACVESACRPCDGCDCTTDSDCDGIPNTDEDELGGTDTDGDGSPDYLDLDSDNDNIPDEVEGGSADADGDGTPNFRETDSDNDGISDTYEAGPAPSSPVDTDGDLTPDYADTDSDDDGIDDRCEAADPSGGLCTLATIADEDPGCAGMNADQATCETTGLCAWSSPNCTYVGVLDSDGDGDADFRDTDSDNDGISDTIEARDTPADAGTLSSSGVDHDSDGTPDYRDIDSDDDGVNDIDEDTNGDGIVNCQVDGTGAAVADARPTPACGDTINYAPGPLTSYDYDYNPGCPGNKCLLAESSRVHPDTDGDGTGDGNDGIFLVCSTENLKPINLFYSRDADYALALEDSFTSTDVLTRSGDEAGLTFDDPTNANGSYGVSGFVLNKSPDATALAASDDDLDAEKIAKALAQSAADQTLLAGATDVSSLSLVINRNGQSFDGYGIVLSRFSITTSSAVTVNALRDSLVASLDGTVAGFGGAGGPSATEFTLLLETLYRYDAPGGVPSPESVVILGALSPSGATDTAQTYGYRTLCGAQADATACGNRVGCFWSGTACEEDETYQIPLFFADNVTNGSALAQFGDDLAALCQSMVQENGLLDFLWMIDNSGSMQEEIDQVSTAASLFFALMSNTEADYRVAQITSAENRAEWPPQYDFSSPSTDELGRRNGMLYGGFTGARAGVVNPADTDRNYDGDNDPATYFSSRLPSANGSGQEFGLLMGQWAVYRASAQTLCTGGDQTSCEEQDGCVWDGSVCGQAFCAAEITADECAPLFAPDLPDPPGSHCIGLGQTACGTDADCEWHNPPNADSSYSECVSLFCRQFDDYNNADWDDDLGVACSAHPACEHNNPPGGSNIFCDDRASHGPSYCERLGARSGDAACNADPSCSVFDDPNDLYANWCVSDACRSHGDNDAGDLDGVGCTNNATCVYVDPPDGPNGFCADWQETPILVATPAYDHWPAGCEWRESTNECLPAVGIGCGTHGDQTSCDADTPRCAWNGTLGICEPDLEKSVLCDGSGQTECEAQGGGWCEWDVGGFCRPPEDYAFRTTANRTMVILSDEEECYLKDHDEDGNCEWSGYGLNITPYDDETRAARIESFERYYEARGFTVFGIVGDRADPALAPANGNGGCSVGTNEAEAGQSYINVAESSGGGWGSICAADLYPTIESIVINSISNASPYRLEGFIDGQAVQPIASTIKVAAETCVDATEYPSCIPTGTEMRVVPRSRESGFDYDAVNNSLILYGNARPVSNGDIVVSYRYWIDNEQPPEGGSCPCPETTGPDCECPVGQACGIENDGTDLCSGLNQASCEQTAGCDYNQVGGCFASGLCEPDPTCGGVPCGDGFICDPNLGLCVCDVECGGGCGGGDVCDDNVQVNPCQGLDAAACGADPDCAYNSDLGQCLSLTCGQCVCNTDPAGCPAGQDRDIDTNSATCGLCLCDTDCGSGCDAPAVCDDNASCGSFDEGACGTASGCSWDANVGICLSAACGFCQPPSCGNCPDGTVCDPGTGTCSCDQSCGGGCLDGQFCQSDTGQAQCGQCLCDETCGGPCPTGTFCDVDTGSPSCGLCLVDQACGIGCASSCESNGDESTCVADSAGCRWSDNQGACYPLECRTCNGGTGQCEVDSDCCGSCDIDETCNDATGACECATDCGGACPAGTECDPDLGSETCGSCVCDEDCGGDCPTGTICSDPGLPTCGLCLADPECGVPDGECNADCSGAADTAACGTIDGCYWAGWLDDGAGGCRPLSCTQCNSSSGLCQVDVTCCGGCGPRESCNEFTGECECDTTCGAACGPGLECDSDPGSESCGECLCDKTCGGVACPNGLVCDDNAVCDGLGESGCDAEADCVWDVTAGECLSPYCGRCVVDPTCGGCDSGQVCNPTTGLCVVACPDCPLDPVTLDCACDPATGFCGSACPACPTGEMRDPLTGECVCDQTCGTPCPLGSACDGDLGSGSCGQCVCDTTCGANCAEGESCDDPCPSGQLCDDGDFCSALETSAGGACVQDPDCVVDATTDTCVSPTCGLCVVDPTCGGECPDGFICDELTGLCTPDADCDCPSGFTCDPITLLCYPNGG